DSRTETILIRVQNFPLLPVHPLPAITKLGREPSRKIIAGVETHILFRIGIRKGDQAWLLRRSRVEADVSVGQRDTPAAVVVIVDTIVGLEIQMVEEPID